MITYTQEAFNIETFKDMAKYTSVQRLCKILTGKTNHT